MLFIRPILRGRDIKRYGYEFADLWLITTFPSLKIDIENYPAVKEHLLSFGYNRLNQNGKNGARKKTNNKWFETQDSISYWDDFSKPKIVWKRVGSILRFSYDDSSIMTLDSTCFATGGVRLKYILSVLNSNMGHYLLKDSPKTGTGDLLISVQAIEPVKVPVIDDEINLKIIPLVDKMLSTNGSEESQILFQKIDKLIYKLYQLDENEIQFIENQQIESLKNQG